MFGWTVPLMHFWICDWSWTFSAHFHFLLSVLFCFHLICFFSFSGNLLILCSPCPVPRPATPTATPTAYFHSTCWGWTLAQTQSLKQTHEHYMHTNTRVNAGINALLSVLCGVLLSLVSCACPSAPPSALINHTGEWGKMCHQTEMGILQSCIFIILHQAQLASLSSTKFICESTSG